MANNFPCCDDVEFYYEFEHLFDLAEGLGTCLMFFGGTQIHKHGKVNATLLGETDNIKVKLAGGSGTRGIYGRTPVVILWTTAHEKRDGKYALLKKEVL